MSGLETVSLSTGLWAAFGICLLMTFFFEFVNGFHDTANAVATVIYTKTLKPIHAVVWSGIWNSMGVLFSSYFLGLAVATKIANLLPVEAVLSQSTAQAACMILAVLCGAIVWNLGTWYLGIPCSSSHTLVGAILGVGLVFSTLPENTTHSTVDWAEAIKIAESLLFSPLFGFSMAVLLMFILRSVMQSESRKSIFKPPVDDNPPPLWIRAILVTTCTLVSFGHGSNDGQKGLGILMLALISFMPLRYSLSPDFEAQHAVQSLTIIQQNLPTDITSTYAPKELKLVGQNIEDLKQDIKTVTDLKSRLNIRKRLGLLGKNIKTLLDEPNVITNIEARNIIKKETASLTTLSHYVPNWAIALISIALGLGTMIGWKRIVVTIGEKIGKRHMTYAEGATAEVIAAFTIGLATLNGLPVSTTHVLSSGVAGAMVASKGVKNLQRGTIANIALAWILTLPASILLAGGFYLFFRLFV